MIREADEIFILVVKAIGQQKEMSPSKSIFILEQSDANGLKRFSTSALEEVLKKLEAMALINRDPYERRLNKRIVGYRDDSGKFLSVNPPIPGSLIHY